MFHFSCHQEPTCAFYKGETRQQTTEEQFKLKVRSIIHKLGSKAYIRHFQSTTSANFGPETENIAVPHQGTSSVAF